VSRSLRSQCLDRHILQEIVKKAARPRHRRKLGPIIKLREHFSEEICSLCCVAVYCRIRDMPVNDLRISRPRGWQPGWRLFSETDDRVHLPCTRRKKLCLTMKTSVRNLVLVRGLDHGWLVPANFANFKRTGCFSTPFAACARALRRTNAGTRA
jgi:hypothetical protein